MKFPVVQVSNETAEQRKDPSFWEKAKETHNHFRKFRAEIIEAALFVENSLTNLLLDFFSYPSNQRRNITRSLIFDAEFCTFFQKWKLLRELLSLYGKELGLIERDMKKIKSELHKLISLRNRFAHGTIYVDARNFTVWIQYVEGGNKEEQVDENELSKITDKCDHLHKQLYQIHMVIESLDYKLPNLET